MLNLPKGIIRRVGFSFNSLVSQTPLCCWPLGSALPVGVTVPDTLTSSELSSVS